MDESGKKVFRAIKVVESLYHRSGPFGVLEDLSGIAAVADSASDDARHGRRRGDPFGEGALLRACDNPCGRQHDRNCSQDSEAANGYR
jgi:hypothetical protein